MSTYQVIKLNVNNGGSKGYHVGKYMISYWEIHDIMLGNT